MSEWDGAITEPLDEWSGARIEPMARPSWSQAIGNIPSDIGKTVDEITSLPGKVGQASALAAYNAAHDPVGFAKDVAMAPVNLAKAGGRELLNQGSQIVGALTGGHLGETQDEAIARLEARRNAIIERPATTLANVALSGMPSGKLAPLQNLTQYGLKGVTAATREVANLPTMALAGVGRQTLNDALAAGKLGGPEGAVALAQMRGGDPMPVAYQALDAFGQLGADKNAAYLADATKWNVPGRTVDVNPLRQAHADAVAANTMPTTGAPRDPQAALALNEIKKIIDTHSIVPEHLTPEGIGAVRLNRLTTDEMDTIKKNIGALRYGDNAIAKTGAAREHATNLYDAARQGVADVAPEYSAAMERSQANIQKLNDIRNELSLNPKASKGTILRKLQSAQRNQVSSGFMARSKMVDELATKDPTLRYALAGQDLSAAMPRGLSRIFPGLETGAAGLAVAHGGLAALPGILATGIPLAAMASPRLMGEARYGLGVLNRGARNIGVTQQNIGRATEAARIAGLLSDEDRNKPRGLLNP
jgi:hypothetical protein